MFNEADYYSAFKEVRNRFRKYRYYELIAGSLAYIHAATSNKFEALRRCPWLALLFIKWLLLDDSYPNRGGKIPSQNDVLKLLQAAYDLQAKMRLPSEYEHHTLFFRNIAYQQFLYQTDFGYSHLVRQSILFSGLPANHILKKEFESITGLKIQEFLDLCFMTLIKFLASDETLLKPEWYVSVYSSYPKKTVHSFLCAVSKEIDEARTVLLKRDKGKRLSVEQFEQSPFIEFPLLKVPAGYLLTHKNILFRSMETFIYDTLRQWDAELFMTKFGELFERYVEHSLEYAEVAYYTEDNLKKMLGETGNQIDFLIQGRDENIFVDAKAVEMNYQGRTTHSPRILRDKTKNSILKAVKQAHDVIRKLTDSHHCKIPNKKDNYLIVVTFKELYLGNGATYYEIVAKEKMDEIYANYAGYQTIPPENIYFITVDDLDLLCEILGTKKLALSEIIETSKRKDRDPETRNFDFRMHLHNLGIELKLPAFLRDKKDEIIERIAGAISVSD